MSMSKSCKAADYQRRQMDRARRDAAIGRLADDIHKAFFDPSTGICGELTFVGEGMVDWAATIDGDVNFQRLAEWMMMKMAHIGMEGGK